MFGFAPVVVLELLVIVTCSLPSFLVSLLISDDVNGSAAATIGFDSTAVPSDIVASGSEDATDGVAAAATIGFDSTAVPSDIVASGSEDATDGVAAADVTSGAAAPNDGSSLVSAADVTSGAAAPSPPPKKNHH